MQKFVTRASRGVRPLQQRSKSSLPHYVTSFPSPVTKKAANGVTVAAEAGSGEFAVVAAYINSGSRYENPATSGASNLITRLAFKGYEKELEKLGGSVSAWTSREATVFKLAVLKQDVTAAADLLGKAITNPKFSDGDVDCEKAGIIAALEEAKVTAYETLLFDNLHATAFQGTPLGQPVTGSAESVAGISKGDLLSFIKSNFLGSRTSVVGTGAVSGEGLASSVGSWAVPSVAGGVDYLLEPAVFTGSDLRARFDSYPRAHLAVAFQTAGWTSKHQVPLMLAQTILGSWDKTSGVGINGASPLSQVVGEGSLADSYTAFNLAYKDTGLFGVYAVAPDNKLEDLMWYIAYHLVALVHKTSEEQLVRAKSQLKANYLASVSSVDGANDVLGKQLLAYGRPLSAAEFFSRVDAVTLADVKGAADAFINDQDHALSAVGPLHELPDYNWIRRRSYWLRY